MFGSANAVSADINLYSEETICGMAESLTALSVQTKGRPYIGGK